MSATATVQIVDERLDALGQLRQRDRGGVEGTSRRRAGRHSPARFPRAQHHRRANRVIAADPDLPADRTAGSADVDSFQVSGNVDEEAAGVEACLGDGCRCGRIQIDPVDRAGVGRPQLNQARQQLRRGSAERDRAL